MTNTLILGAVAYDAKVVPIWDGFKAWFAARELDFDYVLFTNYERQVEAHLRGDVHVAWNSPLAWLQAERAAAVMTTQSRGNRILNLYLLRFILLSQPKLRFRRHEIRSSLSRHQLQALHFHLPLKMVQGESGTIDPHPPEIGKSR